MMKNSLLNLSIVFSVGLFLVLSCSAPKEPNSTTKTDTPPTSNATVSTEKPITISSKDLTKTFEENELAANEKYNDKILAVSGKVENIAETMGNITVSLQGHNAVLSVMCNFEESEKPSVTKVKKGQQVTLIGKGDGMTMGLYVGLQGCKVQQIK
jgi:hypothetical protein